MIFVILGLIYRERVCGSNEKHDDGKANDVDKQTTSKTSHKNNEHGEDLESSSTTPESEENPKCLVKSASISASKCIDMKENKDSKVSVVSFLLF